ncbi:MAG: biopolymer transporter ExbD [Desulfobulbaceae bacterium]|uniref:Biopolymer transporter ExbD n=1 Tax=Candidatus Desulfobia pelagia TaxID=2841692 RepID=A0A8J6NEN9_9BACT|nr:biopolymer transporter ExbD [Candidatus Desulfobia pelagia]
MDEKSFESINVIPLVDVMLVLLTIVLTTSTFIAMGAIPVELPKATGVSTAAVQSVTIEIDRQGNLFLDADKMTLPVIADRLQLQNRETPLLIRADKSIALQKFVDVMDLVKGLGFRKVSLQTEVSQ